MPNQDLIDLTSLEKKLLAAVDEARREEIEIIFPAKGVASSLASRIKGKIVKVFSEAGE